MTKTMCGADCWTDHRLVVSKLNLRIQPVRRPQGKKVPKKLDVFKLKQDSRKQAFVNDLCSRLDALEHSSEDVDDSWTVFRDTVHSSAMYSLGPVSRKHQDWFDDKEIQGLLEEKHQKTRGLQGFLFLLGLGRAAICDCGTPWTFLLPFLPQKYQLSI